MTCPAYEWAMGLRQGERTRADRAEFPTRSGETVLLPSVTRSESDYKSMLTTVGFHNVKYFEFSLPATYPLSRIPPTIIGPAARMAKRPHDLKLVAVALAFKAGNVR